mgnify:FL=1
MTRQRKHFITDDEYALLEENGITEEVFKSRLRKKWSRHRALHQPVIKHQEFYIPKQQRLKMLVDLGITYSIYRDRREKGWSDKDAKTTPVHYKNGKSPYRQFNQRELECLVANYVTYSDYKNRRKIGWTREEAIYIPKGIKRYEIYENELYPITREDFIEIYNNGSTIDTYRKRRHLGWTHEKAKKTPKKPLRTKKDA